MLESIVILFVSLFLLVKATGMMIESFNNLSRSVKIETFALAGFLSAFATSLPELFVSISSATNNNPQLALGVILGSNIADITLVLGIVALVGGGLPVTADFVSKDLFRAFLVLITPFILAVDGYFSRFDGLILLAVFCMYHLSNFYQRSLFTDNFRNHPFTQIGHWLKHPNRSYEKKQFAWLFLGIIILLVSSHFVVTSALSLSSQLSLPVLFVGIFVIALGSCLPELAFELRAVKGKHFSMALGDLLGSLVVNSSLILAVTILIKPFALGMTEVVFVNSILFFLLGFFLFWTFLRTKYRISVFEGLILIIIYLCFFLIELQNLPYFG